MKKMKHKEFMSSNKLDNSAFSEAVQKKVRIFDKMHSKLEDMVDEDRIELLDQLKELDHELHEDMLNELEDQLENNEVIEEQEKKPEPKPEKKKEEPKPAYTKGDAIEITGGNPKYVGVIAEVIEYHSASGKDKESVTVKSNELPDGKSLLGVGMVKPTSKKPKSVQAIKKESKDEEILEELWKNRKTKGLGRSFLKEKGVKTNITGWTIQIGNFVLNRAAIFSYKYNLEKLKM